MAGKVSKLGDWDLIGLITNNMRADMKWAAEQSVRRFALYAEKRAKEHITNQDLPWQPLKPSYKKRKENLGLSENILVATSTYFQTITSWREGMTGFAGVKRGVTYTDKEGTAQVANIAAIHEYGTLDGRIPARPLWGPVFQEAKNWHMEKNTVSMVFAERLKSKYNIHGLK